MRKCGTALPAQQAQVGQLLWGATSTHQRESSNHPVKGAEEDFSKALPKAPGVIRWVEVPHRYTKAGAHFPASCTEG